ncbi:glucosamine-6-phosphate deaminase [Sphingobacterium haloxyli]|uniref:Glucosamine-6-phosphate deaminase n=1 Tax=Sphingobacterium haloxyli TaxID=2100533 RepID=A0A2S9J5V3_9SPHI|nr:glucosamine-6-phosphate deaminase [Sphingobacterium haloxyli]PRD48124.1 glucosamine-6-phosphate deaminase [Sphingobacterium haloxyli]
MEIEQNKIEQLQIRTYENREQLGQDAGQMVSKKIQELQQNKDYVYIIFASAPSQNEFLETLARDTNIAWEKVVAFHMDEYIGLDLAHPQSFGYFLKENLFDKVPIHHVHYIQGDSSNIEKECERYEQLLRTHPVDIVCMGIGENTHIAFNDPHVADFNDPYWVKIVDLDDESRQQQVNDGCFGSFSDVPTHAITLTVPALLQGEFLYCMVPGKNKAKAVYQTLYEGIDARYPSTILRKHQNAHLFIDKESAQHLHESL